VRMILGVMNAFQLKILTDAYGLNLTFPQWYGLSRMTTFAGLLLPFPASASFRAMYLKRFHDFPYSSFLASNAITSIIKIMLNALFAVLILLPRWRISVSLLLFAAALFTACAGFLLLAHRIPSRWLSFWVRLQHLAAQWGRIRSDRRSVLQLGVLHAASFVVAACGVVAAFRAFNIEVPFAACAVIAAYGTISGTMKLIPGDLGSREFLYAFISSVFGVGVNEALHAAVLHRIVETILTLLLTPTFLIPLNQPKRDKP